MWPFSEHQSKKIIIPLAKYVNQMIITAKYIVVFISFRCSLHFSSAKYNFQMATIYISFTILQRFCLLKMFCLYSTTSSILSFAHVILIDDKCFLYYVLYFLKRECSQELREIQKKKNFVRKKMLSFPDFFGQSSLEKWSDCRCLKSFTVIKKFFIKDFFGKCEQIRRKLRIWLHLLNKFLMENFIFAQCKLVKITNNSKILLKIFNILL